MQEVIIKCDKCGKDISPKQLSPYGYKNHIEIELKYCHYGSIGGEEDVDRLEFDLCDNCSSEFAYEIKKWLKK